LWSYNENEEDIAPTGMVLAYKDDEIEQTVHDVILDDGLGYGSEVPVPITGETTMLQPLKLTQFTSRSYLMWMDSILKMRTMTLYGNTWIKMKMLPMKGTTTRISNQ
jgi:hypothetical protein